MSLKFKDQDGKVVGVLKDDASEPEMEEKSKEKECCGDDCGCNGDCDKEKEGESE